ncbi:hypothetical protein BGZ94_007312, partial [Podila epigama]
QVPYATAAAAAAAAYFNMCPQQFVPPSSNITYNDVWPVTIEAPERGTFDALITSSLRLDEKVNPSIGAVTPTFMLASPEDSRATRIYLDKESLDASLKMAVKKLWHCQQELASEGEKKRTLGIIEALDLQPLALKDAHGAEQDVLAHPSVIKRLSSGHVSITSAISVPQKRKLDDAHGCCNCNPVHTPALEYVLSTSPYAASLSSRKQVTKDQNDHLSVAIPQAPDMIEVPEFSPRMPLAKDYYHTRSSL